MSWPFDLEHSVVIALMLIIPGLAAWGARKSQGVLLGVRWSFTVMLVGNKFFALYLALNVEGIGWRDILPLHVCDLATLWVILALWSRNQIWMDLAYFWGLAGTLQGVLTPDLPVEFPHARWFSFFISHAGIVAGVLYLVWGERRRVYLRSVWAAWKWIMVYAVCVSVVNVLLGTNYGYLCAPPQNPSLIDYLGPWPWYIGSLMILAVVKFFIYYLPFAWSDFRRRQQGAAR
ncbi:MAG: TIGR02206 family membrane protein [Verrucomicrobiae bacterium]|nr:TIGR02206 family membrane protein [Verrucomicrobiae bacterium]